MCVFFFVFFLFFFYSFGRVKYVDTDMTVEATELERAIENDILVMNVRMHSIASLKNVRL